MLGSPPFDTTVRSTEATPVEGISQYLAWAAKLLTCDSPKIGWVNRISYLNYGHVILCSTFANWPSSETLPLKFINAKISLCSLGFCWLYIIVQLPQLLLVEVLGVFFLLINQLIDFSQPEHSLLNFPSPPPNSLPSTPSSFPSEKVQAPNVYQAATT